MDSANRQKRFISVIFLGLVMWWLVVNVFFDASVIWHALWTGLYGVIAIGGGIFGLLSARVWGGWKTAMGKAIIFFSVGLLSQEFGQVAYSYSIYFKQIELPYPSIGEIGYFSSIPLYVMGIFYFAKSVVKGGLLKLPMRLKIFLIIFPLLFLAAALPVVTRVYNSSANSWLAVLLAVGYVLGGAFYVSLSAFVYLFAREKMIGIFDKISLKIFLALTIQCLADLVFLYQFNEKTWVTAGINDLMYLLAYYGLAVGLLDLRLIFENLQIVSGRNCEPRNYFQIDDLKSLSKKLLILKNT